MRQIDREFTTIEPDEVDGSAPWDAYPARENGERLLTFLRKRDLSFLLSDAAVLESAISEFLDPIEASLQRNGTPPSVARWWCEQICIEAEACEADIG